MHSLTATIEKGEQFGRTTGYPTINLNIPVPLHLPHGVYYGTVSLQDNRMFDAAIIVGTPHKIHTASIQAFILDFDEEIYQTTVTINIKQFVRPLIKFNNKKELIKQIKEDIAQIQKLIDTKTLQ